MNKNLYSTALLGSLILFSTLAIFAQNPPKFHTRILLIPLDDRPPCLQFPVKMGLIGNAEVVAPPREILGRFTEAGKSDKIINWIKTQDLKSFDAAIISVDMLAYGGLVAMRVHDTDDKTALKRLEFLREMRRLAPQLKIYGSSVIMRLAPTGTGANESYRENLAKWAEISVDPNLKTETAELEQKIPAEALANYKAARVRDLKINRESINLVRDNIFDYLILSQDDAKPKGVHVADRENLIALTKKLNLTEKVAIQPGADEVSMLLLSRSLTDKYNYHPKIRVIYSSETDADRAMAFEDRPLRQTVSFQIKAAGASEFPKESTNFDMDANFFVFTSRHEKDGARLFAEKIWNGKHIIIVADIDPRGDVQGGDANLVEYLRNPGLLLGDYGKKMPTSYANLLELNGYASWNTAGNTIGTALPQGILSGLSNDNYFDAKFLRRNKIESEEMKADFLKRISTAHDWFIINRLLDDYAFHTIVRPQAAKMIRENKWNALRLTDEQTKIIEEYCLKELQPFAEKIAADYKEFYKGKCEMSPMTFDLPWNRTFEAEINFNLQCQPDNK